MAGQQRRTRGGPPVFFKPPPDYPDPLLNPAPFISSSSEGSKELEKKIVTLVKDKKKKDELAINCDGPEGGLSSEKLQLISETETMTEEIAALKAQRPPSVNDKLLARKRNFKKESARFTYYKTAKKVVDDVERYSVLWSKKPEETFREWDKGWAVHLDELRPQRKRKRVSVDSKTILLQLKQELGSVDEDKDNEEESQEEEAVETDDDEENDYLVDHASADEAEGENEDEL